MKIILLLIFVWSCGKNTNYSNNQFPEMKSLQVSDRLIPNALTFKAGDHEILFKPQRFLPHHFFEMSTDLIRYYSFELSHIHPDSIYELDTNLSSHFEIYLHDQGRDILINQKNFKINIETLERLEKKKSYLYISFTHKNQDDGIVIKNFQTGESLVWKSSIEDYLKDQKLEATALDFNSLIQEKGDNIKKWWIKKDSPGQFKIVYSSLNDLKEAFDQNFTYQKHVLKRLNGQASSLKLNGYSFFRISGSRTLQRKVENIIHKTYYTNVGSLPYQCSFTQAHAEVISQEILDNSAMREALNTPDLFLNSWSYFTAPTLLLNLKSLDSGYFDIGITSRNCITSKGPRIDKKRVNVEKVMELVIESYSRRE